MSTFTPSITLLPALLSAITSYILSPPHPASPPHSHTLPQRIKTNALLFSPIRSATVSTILIFSAIWLRLVNNVPISTSLTRLTLPHSDGTDTINTSISTGTGTDQSIRRTILFCLTIPLYLYLLTHSSDLWIKMLIGSLISETILAEIVTFFGTSSSAKSPRKNLPGELPHLHSTIINKEDRQPEPGCQSQTQNNSPTETLKHAQSQEINLSKFHQNLITSTSKIWPLPELLQASYLFYGILHPAAFHLSTNLLKTQPLQGILAMAYDILSIVICTLIIYTITLTATHRFGLILYNWLRPSSSSTSSSLQAAPLSRGLRILRAIVLCSVAYGGTYVLGSRIPYTRLDAVILARVLGVGIIGSVYGGLFWGIKRVITGSDIGSSRNSGNGDGLREARWAIWRVALVSSVLGIWVLGRVKW